MIGPNQQTGLVFVLFSFSFSCSNATGPKCSTRLHQVLVLSRSEGPHTVKPCLHPPFTSSDLSTFMNLATHPIKNKWEPTYLHPPQPPHNSPQTPYASSCIAHSFVLDPSQQEAAFSPTTRGGPFGLAPVMPEILSHKCGHESKVSVTFVLYPSFFHS